MLSRLQRAIFPFLLILISLCGICLAEDTIIPSFKDFIAPTLETEATPEPEFRGVLVTSIEVKGNKAVPVKDITDAVFSKVGDPFLEPKVSADEKAIYRLGYFADVVSDARYFKGGRKLIFTVTENPVVAAIAIEGNSALSTEALLGTMETKPGEILNFTKLRDDMARINDYYKNEGYILARVVDVAVDPKTSILRVKIIEGVIEEIKIEGNDKTQDYVIRRELKTKTGKPLNEKTLSKDLRRIFNLGFFSEVNPAFVPGTSPDKVDIVVRVKEQSTNTINFGGGYGERDGWFGFMDLSVNNLMGTGQALMIKGQSGQQAQTYQFKYFNPWVLEDKLGDHTSFTFRKWYTIGSDVYYVGQNEVHNGWDVAFSKPFYEDIWRATLSFGSEWVGPYADSSFEAYDSSNIGLALSYDTRDNWMDPHEGVLHTVSTKWGWKFTSSTTQFNKYGLDLNFFVPLAERQTLALHGGTGIAVGDVPVGETYWVGGANTVRGYAVADARLGTRKMIANIEYRYTFNEIFQAVLFFDWGDAWYEGAPDLSKFISGKGFGVRINVPMMGPLRLDYGIPAGGNFGDGQLHFSIGQTF